MFLKNNQGSGPGACVIKLIMAIINGNMNVLQRNHHGQIVYVFNQFLCSPCKMLDGLWKNDNFFDYGHMTVIWPLLCSYGHFNVLLHRIMFHGQMTLNCVVMADSGLCKMFCVGILATGHIFVVTIC